MADNDRSLYAVTNVGVEATVVTARVIHAVWNVGAYVHYAGRALHAVWNVGFYSVLLMRALYEYVNVSLRTGEDDALEIQLIETDIKDILHILRGK